MFLNWPIVSNLGLHYSAVVFSKKVTGKGYCKCPQVKQPASAKMFCFQDEY